MKENLYQYLSTQSGSLSTGDIIMSYLAAAVIAGIIFVSYQFSHSGTVYSAKFNVSLVMLTLVTTLVMSVIGNNIALSLGMVGALSIVRFRTAIKDSRDTAYIFWCIAAGICCGIQDYAVVGIGTGVIFFAMLLLGNVRNNDRYLLVIRGKRDAKEIQQTVNEYFSHKALFRVDNSDRERTELIYEVSKKNLDLSLKKNEGIEINALLFAIKGVESVNLVCQNDEISR